MKSKIFIIGIALTAVLGAMIGLSACAEDKSQAAPVLKEENVILQQNRLTVTGFDNALYSIDFGTTWQEENVFNDLEFGNTYKVVVKFKETDSLNASPVSNCIIIQLSAPSTQ